MPTSQATSQSRRLGSFEIVEELGQGGMGVVYLARQPALERPVVLKKMRRDIAADPEMVERFQREARSAAAVHHQNVVAVYDCFSIRGDSYIAEEYVDGPDLRSVLDEAGRLDPRVAALIALEVIRGLEEVHARGIVHRDLKPDNILIGRAGEIKIADFGIALDGRSFGLTRPGMMMGSIPYLSPEQMLGERVDYRSDLFVFGILLYEMLTGARPWEPSDEGAETTLLERMQGGRYVSPRRRAKGVPRYLARLIRGCLRPRPARRTGTATAVRRRLERGLGRISPADVRFQIATWLWGRGLIRPDEGATARRPLPPEASAAGLRTAGPRRWAVPAGIAAGLVALGVSASALGVFSPEGELEPRPRHRMEAAASPVPPPPDVVGAAMFSLVPATDDAAPAAVEPLPVEPGPAVPAPAPAQLSLVAWPWAEVRIGDGPTILTPREAPVELPPGKREIVFVHPTYGSAVYTVDLAAGEQRRLVHVFDEAPAP